MDFMNKTKEFRHANMKEYSFRLIIPIIITIIINFILFFINNKWATIGINFAIIGLLVLIIFLHNKAFKFNNYPYNCFLSAYIYTDKAVDDNILSYYENITLDFFGSYDNIKRINTFLDPAIKEINEWVIPNNTFISKRLLKFLNRNNYINNYVKEFVYSYLFIGSEDNYWRALCNGLTIYVQDFNKIKKDALIGDLIYRIINILISFIFFLIFKGLLKNYIFIIPLLLSVLVFKLLYSTLFIFLEKKKIIGEYIKSTENAIINHNLSLTMSKRSEAFLLLILNIDDKEE